MVVRDLSVVLEREQDAIRKYLQCSDAQWESMLRLTAHCWERENEELRDERVRTFALACGYAAARERGLEELTRVLTGEVLQQAAESRIWLEAWPVPPLKREGNTHVDLALWRDASLLAGAADPEALAAAQPNERPHTADDPQ